MSLISMISMEVAMNLTDYILTGGAMLTWWVVPIMLIVGFLTHGHIIIGVKKVWISLSLIKSSNYIFK